MTDKPTPKGDQPRDDGFSSFDPTSLHDRPVESFPDPDEWVFVEAEKPSRPESPAPAGPAALPPTAPPPAMPRPMTPAPPGVPHRAVEAAVGSAAPRPDHGRHHPSARTCGLATGSLVLGILGFLSCGLTGLAGLITGIVAMVSIGRSDGRLRGQGMAVAGLALSVISLASVILYGVVAAFMLPQMAIAAEEESFRQSVARLQTIFSKTETYERLNGHRLPPADDWVRALALDRHLLSHPDDPLQSRCFAMNDELGGRDRGRLADAANTVLYFEAIADGPLAGGPELLPVRSRYYEGYLVVYANGDLGVVPAHDLKTLEWDDKGTD